MVYLLKNFLCCIPLRTGTQIVIWITCLTRLLLVFTTIYLATSLLRSEANQVVTNYPRPSNSSFYYEIGHGIDQLLFFTKGTYIQRYVIMTGITAFFQIIACALGIFALDKGRPDYFLPWLIMFSQACITETGVSCTNLAIMGVLGQYPEYFIADAINAVSHGVFLAYFIWVVFSFYKKEKLRTGRPMPRAPPYYPPFLGETNPPYNPAVQSRAKASTLPAGFETHCEFTKVGT
nr:PREDICTED: uncharacterized protein LOC109038996 [Bemisia tabaci]